MSILDAVPCGLPTKSGNHCKNLKAPGDDGCYYHGTMTREERHARYQQAKRAASTARLCGHPTTSGTACQRNAMPDGRCRRHSDSPDRWGVVYAIRHVPTGRLIYVGQTTRDIRSRMREHAAHYRRHRKIPEDAIEPMILARVRLPLLDACEKATIEALAAAGEPLTNDLTMGRGAGRNGAVASFTGGTDTK